MFFMALPDSLSTHLYHAQCPKRLSSVDCMKWSSFSLDSTWFWPVGNTNRRRRRSKRKEGSEYLFLGFFLCETTFLMKTTAPIRQPSPAATAMVPPKLWIWGNQPLPLLCQP